jgi:predicted phage-related endonuclease
VVAQLSFDKLAFVKRLSAAGMDAQLAEVLAEALDEMVFDTLATKSDLSELGVSLRSEIKELETSLRSEIKELETSLRSEIKELEMSLRSEMKQLELRLTNSLTVRLGAMIAAAVAIIGTLNGLS